MTILTLAGDAADGILDTHHFVIISFVAPGCPACRAFAPVFAGAAERHPDITFCRVDTSREKGLMQAFEVEKVPSLAVLRDQVLLLLQAGGPSSDDFEDLIQRARALDMAQVKRAAEAEAAQDETPE